MDIAGSQINNAAEAIQKHFDPSQIDLQHIKTIEDVKPRSVLHTILHEVWIYNGPEKTINVYDENIKKLKTIPLDFFVSDMTLKSSNDVIVTDRRGKRLLQISPSGDCHVICSTAPMQPRGVCVNDKQQIVVGLADDNRTQMKLVVYSLDSSTVLQEIFYAL